MLALRGHFRHSRSGITHGAELGDFTDAEWEQQEHSLTSCIASAAGIGFKATAVASEVTYISSSGYTFAFDMRTGAYDVPCLGLFCPRWEEGLQEHMLDWLADRLAGELTVQPTSWHIF